VYDNDREGRASEPNCARFLERDEKTGVERPGLILGAKKWVVGTGRWRATVISWPRSGWDCERSGVASGRGTGTTPHTPTSHSRPPWSPPLLFFFFFFLLLNLPRSAQDVSRLANSISDPFSSAVDFSPLLSFRAPLPLLPPTTTRPATLSSPSCPPSSLFRPQQQLFHPP